MRAENDNRHQLIIYSRLTVRPSGLNLLLNKFLHISRVFKRVPDSVQGYSQFGWVEQTAVYPGGSQLGFHWIERGTQFGNLWTHVGEDMHRRSFVVEMAFISRRLQDFFLVRKVMKTSNYCSGPLSLFRFWCESPVILESPKSLPLNISNSRSLMNRFGLPASTPRILNSVSGYDSPNPYIFHAFSCVLWT